MDALYIILFFVVGTIFGSFYNVLGTRIPNHESIVSPRSHCEKCGHTLLWYELIPIISYCLQKGKCRNCKTKLSWLYPFSEIMCGILFALSYYSFGFSYQLLISLIISSVMIVITVSDLSYMIIPDRFIVIPSVLIFLIKIVFLGWKEAFFALGSGIISFFLMYAIMLVGSFIFKKESLGGGDVKLMFLTGLCLEPFLSLVVIIIASFIALPISLFLLIKHHDNVIPFGPFLVVGILLVFFTKLNSQEIINLLLQR